MKNDYIKKKWDEATNMCVELLEMSHFPTF